MKNFKQNSRFGGRGRSDGNRGRGNRDFGPRSMHQATCAECGNACEVPFRPSGDKPVYCSNCFEKNKGSDFRKPARRDFGKSDYGSNQAFSAVCDKCGNACEVPFRPSGDKPVYCDDCFKQVKEDRRKKTEERSYEIKDIGDLLPKEVEVTAQPISLMQALSQDVTGFDGKKHVPAAPASHEEEGLTEDEFKMEWYEEAKKMVGDLPAGNSQDQVMPSAPVPPTPPLAPSV